MESMDRKRRKRRKEQSMHWERRDREAGKDAVRGRVYSML